MIRKVIGSVVGMALFAALAGWVPAAAAAQSASPVVAGSPYLLAPAAPAPATAAVQAAAGDADVTPVALGYLLDDGVFSRIDFPGPDLETVGYGINNRGQVAGGYVDVRGNIHGFLYYKRAFTTFDHPAASGIDNSPFLNYPGTVGFKINARGQIVGAYTGADGTARGFLKSGGSYTKLHVPGATETVALDINDRRQVVGFYTDAGGSTHGFRWKNGAYTTIDFPGAAGTTAFGINNAGLVVGGYLDLGGSRPVLHGFLLDRNGFNTLDFPGGVTTAALDINNRRQVVGAYVDRTGTQHGFLRDRGEFTTIDPPRAPNGVAPGINDRGQIMVATNLRAP
jgi:probable HAF family extracellular repeat protein